MAADACLRATARAKVNLALHVIGQRADGYHLLDSLVAFADIGDGLEVRPAETLSISVRGEFADGVPTGETNIVMRAARVLDPERGAAITLTKNLPHGAGLGGGSADAAAAIRLLSDLWQIPLPAPEALLSLGADVPVCLMGGAARMEGIGEVLSPVALPPLSAVLINPGIPLATATVFGENGGRFGTRLPTSLPGFSSAREVLGWLIDKRNDLEGAALALAPELGEVLAAMSEQISCYVARMSGSGSTCFGLYENREVAEAEAARITAMEPEWWVRAVTLS